MKRILVGVDGSDESKAAVRMAVALAPALRATVLLGHAVRAHPHWLPAALTSSPADHRPPAALLEATARESATPKVDVSTRLLTGGAGAALVHAAHEPEVCLLVVGSRGAGHAKRVLLGSVADRALQQSGKPVLVVKRDSPPPAKGGFILVGVDGSPESHAAARFAADLAEASGASLRACCVVDEPLTALSDPYGVSPGTDLQHREWAAGLLREVVAREERPSLFVDTAMPLGRPAEMLAELSLEEDVALTARPIGWRRSRRSPCWSCADAASGAGPGPARSAPAPARRAGLLDIGAAGV